MTNQPLSENIYHKDCKFPDFDLSKPILDVEDVKQAIQKTLKELKEIVEGRKSKDITLNKLSTMGVPYQPRKGQILEDINEMIWLALVNFDTTLAEQIDTTFKENFGEKLL